MLRDNKHVFWEALVIAIFIFGIGILLGITLENNRGEVIEELYIESELGLLDLRIQSEIFSLETLDCERAAKDNIKFGDMIFAEALTLQELEDSQTLTETLKQQHKKYDLLRTLFWVNSIKVKQRCEEQFHTVVYIYEYKPDLTKKATQEVFSKYLSELKQEYGNKIVLIPIAGNMGLFSTQSLMEEYEITQLPVAIIDEQHKFYEINNLHQIEDLIK